MKGIMKIKFIRSYKGKKIGTIEDVPDRVAHRFVTRGMAKFIRDYKPKRKYESS